MIGGILAIILAYFIGSFPSGLVLGESLWNTDLRRYGSGNIGATNAWRTIGKAAGILVFLLDFAKGAIGVWLGYELSGTPSAMVLGGLAAVVGHTFSAFMHLRGGKGVATGLGVLAVLIPFPSLILFIIWFCIVAATRYVSLGSCVAAILVPIFSLIGGYPKSYTAFGVVAALLVLFRHRANIGRLLNGTESKIHTGNGR